MAAPMISSGEIRIEAKSAMGSAAQGDPCVYEPYADVVAGEWTHLRIIVQGKNASLIRRQRRAALLARSRSEARRHGGAWAGPGTDGYFEQLTISGPK
jgi:hypothetical protein